MRSVEVRSSTLAAGLFSAATASASSAALAATAAVFGAVGFREVPTQDARAMDGVSMWNGVWRNGVGRVKRISRVPQRRRVAVVRTALPGALSEVHARLMA